MREGIRLILEQTQYFGLVLSIGAYLFACWLKNKTKLAIQIGRASCRERVSSPV